MFSVRKLIAQTIKIIIENFGFLIIKDEPLFNKFMILFLNLLIDAFVAKNIFFTRFGLRKFKYFYKESVGTVLKNSICVFAFLATLFLTGFLSKDRLKTQSIWLIIMYAFYFLCFLISVISLYKKKFVLTDLFKIQRYRIS